MQDCCCDQTLNFSWAIGEMDLNNCMHIKHSLSAVFSLYVTLVLLDVQCVFDLIYLRTATCYKWNTLANPIATTCEIWNIVEKRRSSFLVVKLATEIEIDCWECWYANVLPFRLLLPKLDVWTDMLGGSIRNRHADSKGLTITNSRVDTGLSYCLITP